MTTTKSHILTSNQVSEFNAKNNPSFHIKGINIYTRCKLINMAKLYTGNTDTSVLTLNCNGI